MRDYRSIHEIFDILNLNNVLYIVLRNYENLLSPDLFLNGHGDLDILCDDSQRIVNLLELDSYRRDNPPFKGDGVHYYVMINGQIVSIDLRYVGDDYYCRQWEEDMLKDRVAYSCFYVPDNEAYFYSLIYHSILQKHLFSDDYKLRLKIMASNLSIPIEDSEQGYIAILEQYMSNNGYYFTWSADYLVPNRFYLVNQKMIMRNWRNRIRHIAFDAKVSVIDMLVKIKHQIGH